jgi:hypothetical protein
MEPYALGCEAAFTKLGVGGVPGTPPGDVWLQRHMRLQGLSEDEIGRMLEQHYATGGERTIKSLASEAGQAATKSPWYRRLGKALRFVR